MIIAVSFIVIIAVAFYVVVRSAYISASLLSAFAFLTSGAILNLIDRTTYGYVIDFIKIGIIPDFPSFNFADIMIVSGVLGILNIVFKKNQEN